MVGGGNTAVEEALYLSNLADSVKLIHRRDSLSAEKILQDRLFAKDNIEVIWNHQLAEVLGDDAGVTGLCLKSIQDESTQQLDVHGVFIAIGHRPNTDLFAGQLEMNGGYLIVRSGLNDLPSKPLSRSICGDVADHIYRQAITSSGSAHGALDAEALTSLATDSLDSTTFWTFQMSPTTIRMDCCVLAVISRTPRSYLEEFFCGSVW